MKVSDAAKAALEPILAQNPGKLLRIVFEGFGWGGPRLGLTLDESNENDTVLNANGIDLLVEKRLVSFLEDQLIDFLDNERGQGFSISREYGSSCC